MSMCLWGLPLWQTKGNISSTFFLIMVGETPNINCITVNWNACTSSKGKLELRQKLLCLLSREAVRSSSIANCQVK